LTERIPLAALLSGAKAQTAVSALADRIKNGAIFVYPTETIYGIGGRADDETVEKRIRAVKERQKPSPFILIAAKVAHFNSLDLRFTPNAALLAKKFWPGNLTLIVPSPLSSVGVGIRVSNHPFITALFSFLNIPLFSTSANMSDRPYVNDPDVIFKTFYGNVDFMVDAGKLPETRPSTVVKINSDDTVELVRKGVVGFEEIMETINTPAL
jgi:L-threonylcarbamoyladenylate synthase